MTSYKQALYIKGASAASFTIAVQFIVGFGNLWLMNQLLGKEGYGSFALAAAWIFIADRISTAGLDRTLLYRASGYEKTIGGLVGGGLASFALISSFVLGALVSMAVLVAAYFENPSNAHTFWLGILSMTLPFVAVSSVFSAWHQANNKAHIASLVASCQPVFRVLLLGVVMVALPSTQGVAFAIVASAALGSLAWVFSVPLHSYKRPTMPHTRDVQYGIKLMLSRMAQDGVQKIDIIMVGALAATPWVADYAVASRLASLGEIGNRLLAPVFTPRMRYALVQGDHDELLREYDQNRNVSVLISIGVLAMYVVIGGTLLGAFGDYERAYPILLILVVAHAISSIFGASGRYLNMRGYASLTLYTTLAFLMLVIGLNYFAIPAWGAVGAAVSTVFAMFAINSVITAILWHEDGFSCLSYALLSVVAAFLVLAVWISVAGESVGKGGLLLGCSIAAGSFLYVQASSIGCLFRRIVGTLRGGG